MSGRGGFAQWATRPVGAATVLGTMDRLIALREPAEDFTNFTKSRDAISELMGAVRDPMPQGRRYPYNHEEGTVTLTLTSDQWIRLCVAIDRCEGRL